MNFVRSSAFRNGGRGRASSGKGDTSPKVDETTSASDDWTSYKDTERPHQILETLKQLHLSHELVDVEMIVGSRNFSCHRLALMTASPFFQAMFSHTEAEAGNGTEPLNVTTSTSTSQLPTYTLNGIDAGTFSLILDYIYTGECELNEQSVQNLLSASNLLQLFRLKNGCAEFMMQRINVANCIGLYFFARLYQCHLLAAKAKEMICKHFNGLWQEEEFLTLTPDKLVEIIDDDQLEVSQEEVVYEACMEWLNYDLEARRPYVHDVMRCVRFANISRFYFCDKIEENTLLHDDERMEELLAKVRYYHILPNRILEIDLNTCSRDGMSYERGILILANPYSEDQNRKFNAAEFLCLRSGTLIKLGKLPSALYMPGLVVTHDNQVYLAGGSLRKPNARGSAAKDGVSNNLHCSDSSSGTWQVKAKMHRPRTQFALCLVDTYIYAIGGYTGQETLAHVERYDPCTNIWETVAPLPKPLRCMAAHPYRGRLYVFGGETNLGDIVNSVYRYDPVENSWLDLPAMQTPRALAGCAMLNEEMYIVGGNTQASERWTADMLPEFCTASVEIFNPRTDVWRPGPPLPHAICGAGVVRFGNGLRVVGGEDDKSWMAGECVLSAADAATVSGSYDGVKDNPLVCSMSLSSLPLTSKNSISPSASQPSCSASAPRLENESSFEGVSLWKEGQEFDSVMSTFACGVACVNKTYLNHARKTMNIDSL